jgi:hypothetical protein
MQIQFVLAMSGLLPFLLGADAAATWKMYSPSTGSYRVLLPGTPFESTVVQNGTLAHVVKADAEFSNDLLFRVVSMDIPKETIRLQSDAAS